jgi:hypothetical protein
LAPKGRHEVRARLDVPLLRSDEAFTATRNNRRRPLQGRRVPKAARSDVACAERREFDLLLVWSLDHFSVRAWRLRSGTFIASHGVSFRSFKEEHLSTENELVRNLACDTGLAGQARAQEGSASGQKQASSGRPQTGKRLGRSQFRNGRRRPQLEPIAETALTAKGRRSFLDRRCNQLSETAFW